VDAGALAHDLADVGDDQLVRLVADWMDRATRTPDLDLDSEPPLDGRRHVDALIAAAAAQVARTLGRPTPPWTIGPHRRTDAFWHPGPASLFPNALVHAPGEFAVRGVLVEADSLVCV
jgi:hypothetical protein